MRAAMKPAVALWHRLSTTVELRGAAWAAPPADACAWALFFATLFMLLSLGANVYLWYRWSRDRKDHSAATVDRSRSSGRGLEGAGTAPWRPREELLRALLRCTCKELEWILTGLAAEHGPELLHAAAQGRKLDIEEAGQQAQETFTRLHGNGIISRCASTPVSPTPGTATPKSPRVLARHACPMVRFSAFHYYAEEGDDVVLRVVRTGDLGGRSTVRYRSRDSSAVAGVHYGRLDGILTFEPDELEKEIEVSIHENEEYGPSREFSVELVRDAALENAVMDQDLWWTWVEIIDDDFFPTNAYRNPVAVDVQPGVLHSPGSRMLTRRLSDGLGISQTVHLSPHLLIRSSDAEEQFQRLSTTRLLLEFVKFALRDRVVFAAICKMLVADQCENLHGLVNLVVSVYLVDFVVVTSVPESTLFAQSRATSLVLVIAIMVLPLFVLHAMSYFRCSWGAGSRTREIMQTALLRKFLEYSADVRIELRSGDVLMAATHDVYVLVENGLMKGCDLIQMTGICVQMLLFQFIAPALYNRPLRLWLVLCNSTVPVLLWVGAQLRFGISSRSLQKRQETQSALASYVHDTVVLHPLIADYSRRPLIVERYANRVHAFNDAVKTSAQVMINNQFLATWLTTVSVAIFTFFGGMMVINGTMTLGMFLANVRIFGRVGKASMGVYSSWLEVQRVLPALVRITRLLNLPTDNERKNMQDLREHESREQLAQQVQTGVDSAEMLNLMPITFSNISVKFHTKREPVKFTGTVAIEQGKIVVVIGPRGSGKSTFLKVLGGAIPPNNPAGVFVPSHLHVLHLHPESVFFQGSLMDNLTFGIRLGCKGGDEARVRRICERLGISDEVLSYLGTSTPDLPWTSVFSNSQKALLHLARALIASPHVLLLHRPTEIFDPAQQKKIMDVLREFVDERGLEQGDWAQPWVLRPRRTCIVESARSSVINSAGQVICISADGRIETVSKQDIVEEMLG